MGKLKRTQQPFECVFLLDGPKNFLQKVSLAPTAEIEKRPGNGLNKQTIITIKTIAYT